MARPKLTANRSLLWLDRKNKKAAKAVAQAEAAAGAGAGSQGSLVQGEPHSPAFAGDSPQLPHSATFASSSASSSNPNGTFAPPSGLSNMFGRPPTGSQFAESHIGDYHSQGNEYEGTAIGMSPVGLGLPSELRSQEGQTQGLDMAVKPAPPKPLSYASAAAAKVAAANNAKSSNASPTFTASNQENLVSSPRQQQQQSQNGRPPMQSPRFAQQQQNHNVSPTSLAVSQPSLSAARLSTSVPSAFPFEPPASATTHLAHSPRTPSALSSAMYAPAHHSPLFAPALQHHSHSYNTALPGSASGRSLNSPTLSARNLGLASPPIQGHHSQPPPGAVAAGAQRAASGSNVFGTSPFGNNAIFLSSSHEDEKGGFLARNARSVSAKAPPAALRRGSSALTDDDGAEGEEDNVLQEELVPSSLKHLLTPDERARKDSRSGGTSGFFNPFDGDDDEDPAAAGIGIDDEDELDSLHQKYSQSVPAANPFLKKTVTAATYNKAPGSPPTFLSTYFSPPTQAGIGQVHPSSPNTSHLANHLLSTNNGSSGGMQAQPKIERGFYSSSYVPTSAGLAGGRPQVHSQASSSAIGPPNGNSSGNGLANRPKLSNIALGTSLPQGLAAGLSRLHLIPAGTERTGYTPTGTPVSSHQTSGITTATAGGTPSGSLLSSFPASPPSVNGLNPKASAFGGPGTSRPTSSFKLPTLGSLGGGGGGAGTALPHVGSPLARGEMHSYIGGSGSSTSRNTAQQHQQEGAKESGQQKINDGSNRDEDEDLVFDMDV